MGGYMKLLCRLMLVFACLPLSACLLDEDRIVYVADAENLMYTSDGRLLVTGKKNIFQIRSVDGNYSAEPLYPEGDCIFNGVAQHEKWIFTVCNKGLSPWYLYAAGLKDNGEIRFSEIGRIGGFILANGMAFTAQGDLLVADTNLLSNGNYGLAKIKINHSAMPDYNDPDPEFDASKIILSIDKKWLDLNPNGVRVKNNILYITELNALWKFYLDDAGEVASSQLLTRQSGYLDDLYPLCGGALVTNYIEGSIFFVDEQGQVDPVYRTPTRSLGGPTAMLPARSDLFPNGGLVVSEAGIPFEFSGKLGDRVIRLDMGVDFEAWEGGCGE